MKKPFCLSTFFIILLFAVNGYCQKRDGYVITLKGDTVFGKVCYPSPFRKYHLLPMERNFQNGVQFVNDQGEKMDYKPNDLKGFGYVFYGQNVFYESLFLSDNIIEGIPKNDTFFVSRMEYGNINLYRFSPLQANCKNENALWQYVYLIKAHDKSEMLCLAKICDNHLLSDKIIDYLGIENPISKFITDANRSGDSIYLQQIFLSIHQFNAGDTEIKKSGSVGQWFCDTCHCNVFLVKKKDKEFKERKMMFTYAPEGFYMYEGFVYNFKFKDQKLFRGILVKILKDSMVVTSNFNKRVADRDKGSYDTLSFPLSALEKIHFAPNLVGIMGKNISLSGYTIETKNIKGAPVSEFSVEQYGQFKKVRWYFAGDNLYKIYEQDGVVYWL